MRTILILLVLTFLFHESKSQDDCANAVALCAGSIISRTTVGATTNGTDPALTCGDNSVTNSVWFSVIGVVAGNCTITVSNISNNPGLEMQLYTGVCGALVPVGPCTTGSSATGGNMSMSFAIVAGTTYYIMVDGSSSNQEAFDILATTSDDAIVARPDADFNTSPFSGCSPLTVQLQNTTDLHGGSNITYAWRLDAGPYVPGSGSDTSITMTSSGSRTVTLRVCNTECGCKSVTQEIIVQDLFPSISYSPAGACIGTDITFSGSAVILPAVPFVPPAVTNWQWNFGDPSSGANNTAVGQVVNHIFTGGPGTYTVTLTADGNCGPDVIQTTVILRPRPTVSAGPPQIICEGTAATLNATTINLVNPILYNWSGPGIFSCDTCQSSSLSNLLPGGPYPITISVVDSFSCTADTTVNITVNPKPVVNAGSNVQVCQYSTTTLNAVPVTGSSPFSYLWSPTTGLNNPTISNPIASVSGPQTYCVVMTDSIGCASDPDCLDITIFPEPTINAALPVLCASSPTMQNTFTVSGAGAGSSYSWSLSPNYSLISGTNGDSSSVTVTFPTGVAASYTFTAVVVDGITSCRDTVQTVFTVTTGLNMSIAGPTQLCRGDVISLTASGASAYSWTASPAYIFSDSTLATQNVSPLVSTIFTVTGTSGTCSQTIYHNLTVAPKPIANAQPLLPVCGCTNVTLNGSGSTGGMIYHWSSAAGNLITDTLALNTTVQACINDIFTLVVIDPLSTCFEDTSIIVSASPKPPANIIINPDIICDGVSTNIILDGSGSNTDPGTIYHWTSSSGSSTIVDTTSLITTATASTTTIFTLTVTDVAGCDSVVSDTLR
ncbi:MAG: PKD domain-containing protein, partial [Bacteroidia bacterium]|nr:PKD domain-containing protein [Bacteroidia bacterium]